MEATQVRMEESHKSEIQKGIKNHKQIATHLETAAKHHLDAARQHEEGHHDKAAQSTIKAQGHLSRAIESQREDAKHHSLEN